MRTRLKPSTSNENQTGRCQRTAKSMLGSMVGQPDHAVCRLRIWDKPSLTTPDLPGSRRKKIGLSKVPPARNVHGRTCRPASGQVVSTVAGTRTSGNLHPSDSCHCRARSVSKRAKSEPYDTISVAIPCAWRAKRYSGAKSSTLRARSPWKGCWSAPDLPCSCITNSSPQAASEAPGSRACSSAYASGDFMRG